MKSIAGEVAEILIKANAVTFNVERPYTYASGIISPIYTDLRLLVSYPAQRRRIIELLSDLVASKVGMQNVDVISGTASAGVPWAAWLSERLDKPMIYVRKESKQHGKEKVVEGVLKEGERVLVLEDLISTGGSSIRSVHNIRGCMGIVDNCLSIFTYGLDEANKSFSEMKVKAYSLCDFNTALETAVKMKYLTPAQAKNAREWNKNPREWRP